LFIVFFISKGSIKFVTEISQGIFSLSQGTFFGEMELFEGVNNIACLCT